MFDLEKYVKLIKCRMIMVGLTVPDVVSALKEQGMTSLNKDSFYKIMQCRRNVRVEDFAAINKVLFDEYFPQIVMQCVGESHASE